MAEHSHSLTEALKLHKFEKKGSLFIPSAQGQFDIRLKRISDGKILKRVIRKNLVTRLLAEYLSDPEHTPSLRSQCYAFVTPDDTDTAIFKNVYFAPYFDGMGADFGTPSYNETSKTWTIDGTIAATTAGHTREVRTVGLAFTTQLGGVNWRYVKDAFAVTKLSSSFVQTSTEQIEILYRLAFQRV